MTRRRANQVSLAVYGGVLAVPALLAAFLSAGSGHGDYVIANLLFPLPILIGQFSETAVVPMFLACIQFPAYGLIVGSFEWKGACVALVAILLFHAAVAATVFAGS